jgi:SPASM domain peptide maturase of grasp-with-spasm system
MRFFNLFSNITIIKGINRVLFSDLQRNVSELYPIELSELVDGLKKKSIEDLFNDYDSESKEILQEYLDVLLDKEYGFITLNDWDFNFPPMSTTYNDYSTISNLFIELNDVSLLSSIKQTVEDLSVKYLVIFCERTLQIEDFIQIDNYFDKSSLVGIEIYLPFYKGVNKNFINQINEKTFRIYNLVFYDCKSQPFKNKNNFRFSLEFTEEKLVRASCGKISLDYFNTNISKVLESLNHNSCLHKKISIDKDGNIKNCPSMPQSFGNIKDTTLEEALKHPDFKKYWNVTKDMIDVCKDCEFRHICTDCRAYTERNTFDGDIDLSKPLKCGYNPYTNEWAEWSTNSLKDKAIEYYGMQDLVKKDA